MTWREKLPELEGLPLLPCGAGEKWKAPQPSPLKKMLDAFKAPLPLVNRGASDADM